MENAGREHGIGFAFEQDISHMFAATGAPARHHRHPDRFANATRDDQVESCFCSVGVDTVEDDFARAEGDGFASPLECVPSRRLAYSVGKDLPSLWRNALCVNGYHNALT